MTPLVVVYMEPSVERRREIARLTERLGVLYLPINSQYDLFAKKAQLGHEVTWVPLEVTPRAIPLGSFEHPENVAYVVGPQNGTIPYTVLDRLSQPVYVETHPTSPSPVLPTPVVVGVVLHHRITQKEGVVHDGNHHRVEHL